MINHAIPPPTARSITTTAMATPAAAPALSPCFVPELLISAELGDELPCGEADGVMIMVFTVPPTVTVVFCCSSVVELADAVVVDWDVVVS
jgi:hypothetical protein